MISKKAEVIADFLLKALVRHQNSSRFANRIVPPLFVGLQGPQGIGKTTLTNSLEAALHNRSIEPSDPNYPDPSERKPARLAILSLDDFYHPYEQLVLLASKPVSRPRNTKGSPSHSESTILSPNKLLKGRGQPGTHDAALLHETLVELSQINSPLTRSTSEKPILQYASITLPRFDKSLHSGMGDRVPPDPDSPSLTGPIDIVVLEGWCMGFHPMPPSDLETLWVSITGEDQQPRSSRPEVEIERSVISRLGVTLPEVEEINEHVRQYAELIYPFFTAFIQLAPDESTPYSLIYRWRLEQEHNMKAQNGGRGMTDEQVESFIDRYIPGYAFFGGGVREGYVRAEIISDSVAKEMDAPIWRGNGLCVVLDEGRELLAVETF